jgi:FkbM family methyltransferase
MTMNKLFFQFFLRRIRVLKTIIVMLLNHNRNSYNFKLSDYYLHFLELNQGLFPAIVTSSLSNTSLLEIKVNKSKIYWPENESFKDLPWLYHEIFTPFKRNPSSYNHPEMRISEKDWIIDAGSAEGYFALFCMEMAKENTNLVIIEPLAIMQNSLTKTFEEYPSMKIKILKTAIGDMDGDLEFGADSNHLCDSKVISSELNKFSSGSIGNYERVSVKKIDTICVNERLIGKGLIKMDIEGFEMKALEGSIETLRKSKPALAIAVYHEYDNAKKCAEIIKKANPEYQIEFRGCYGYFLPPRPYILFAF